MLATWFLTLGALAWAAEVTEEEHCDSPAAEVSFLQVDLDVDKDKSEKMVPQFEKSKSGDLVLPGRKEINLEPEPALKPMYSADSQSSMLEGTADKTEKAEENTKTVMHPEMDVSKAAMHPEMDVSKAGDLELPDRQQPLEAEEPPVKPQYDQETPQHDQETPQRFSKGWLKRLLQVKSTPYPQTMMMQKNEVKKQRKASSSQESSSEMKDPEQRRVILTQLVASSLAGEQTAVKTKDSLTSLLINILVIGLVFALGVLLYTNGWNWKSTVEEVEKDPRVIYSQFEQGGSGRRVLEQNGFINGRRGFSDTCC